MGLLPLEFSDCMLDSPYFRENLKAHEKQLDQTSTDIKAIIKDIQDVLDAAKILSKAKRTLAHSLSTFQFDCLGTSLTDDEVIISITRDRILTAGVSTVSCVSNLPSPVSPVWTFSNDSPGHMSAPTDYSESGQLDIAGNPVFIFLFHSA